MQQRHLPGAFPKVLLFLLAAIMAVQCSFEKSKQKQKEANMEDYLSGDDIFDDIYKAKKIFYALPSPIETAMLIKSTGADYNEQLLNPTANVRIYTTTKSQALNLGIYTTDLSFASLFDQAQTSINYMEAAKKMAENLDIADAIDENTLKRLEENLNNRDVIMDIISETFLNSSADLQANDRASVAAMVLVGGWIEGLYLASQLVGDKEIKDNMLVDRIAEQKLSFKIVQRMLEDNSKNPAGEEIQDIKELISELEPVKNAYDKIKVETSEIKAQPNSETNVTTLLSETRISITKEAFKELSNAVSTLRNNFVQ